MYFKRNAIYFNNLTISVFALIFFIYGHFRTNKFVNFYSKKFYLVFVLHFSALILNGAHAIIIQHDVFHVTFLTEFSMFIVLFFILLLMLFWTYQFYLKHIYSLITGSQFKSITRLLTWNKKSQNYYDYESVNMESGDINDYDDIDFYESENEITEQGSFRYINYLFFWKLLVYTIVQYLCSTTYLFSQIDCIELKLE